MDLSQEELQSVGPLEILRCAVAIPRAAPRAFALITLSLIFPLSFAVLAHSLFTHPILLHLQSSHPSSAEWARLFAFQFLYLLFLFVFSLVSTGAVVFSVASLYSSSNSKPASFASALSALPPILPRLLKTFLWVFVLMLVYHLVFALCVFALLLVFDDNYNSPFFALLLAVTVLVFVAAHVYISALWHLASVVSVLEPVCGLAAMAKSRQLLRGRGRVAATLVVAYFAACGVTGAVFKAAVVRARSEEGSFGIGSLPARALLGGALVAVLVMVNLVGLLVQSVFYYVCKSYHHQQIDKSALYDHLGGYLGEYVPLKSSVQMENM